MNLASANNAVLWDQVGLKSYELGNHLGNVLATISDKRTGVDGNYEAEVKTMGDYYPFGMRMPGRTWMIAGGKPYFYGFNGRPNDSEVKGEGNQIDYDKRIYDPRVGRFLSTDPLTKEYPWYTPYQFAGNSPVKYVDLDGGEPGYSYRNEHGVMITVPAGDNLQRRVPPEHLKYLPDGSAAGQRNFALEFAVGVGAPVGLVADAGTGFTVTRTVLQVATVVTAANMASHMHESGNAKNPVVKQELEHQAKDEAAELVMQWMAGKFLKVAGQALKPLIRAKDLTTVTEHLKQFGHAPENEIMLGRLNKIARGEMKATEIDMNFYKHELREAELMRKGKLGYKEAHEQTLKEQGMYHRDYEKKLYTQEALDAGNEKWIKEVDGK